MTVSVGILVDGYRFGFNGAEKIDEIYGKDGGYDLGARMYNPRLGKMFSTDPREAEYAWQSTYAYYANSPINQLDFNGEGEKEVKETQNPKTNDTQSKQALGISVKYETKEVILDAKSEQTGDRLQTFKFTETKEKTGLFINVGPILDNRGQKGYDLSIGPITIGVDTRNYGLSISHTQNNFQKLSFDISSEGITSKVSVSSGNLTEGVGMTYTPGKVATGVLMFLITKKASINPVKSSPASPALTP